MVTRQMNRQSRILVVGNSPAVNVSLRTMLSFSELHVVATDDADVALSLARNTTGKYALLLLDVSLREIDPQDLASRFRAIQPDIVILFFSRLIDGVVIR